MLIFYSCLCHEPPNIQRLYSGQSDARLNLWEMYLHGPLPIELQEDLGLTEQILHVVPCGRLTLTTKLVVRPLQFFPSPGFWYRYALPTSWMTYAWSSEPLAYFWICSQGTIIRTHPLRPRALVQLLPWYLESRLGLHALGLKSGAAKNYERLPVIACRWHFRDGCPVFQPNKLQTTAFLSVASAAGVGLSKGTHAWQPRFKLSVLANQKKCSPQIKHLHWNITTEQSTNLQGNWLKNKNIITLLVRMLSFYPSAISHLWQICSKVHFQVLRPKKIRNIGLLTCEDLYVTKAQMAWPKIALMLGHSFIALKIRMLYYYPWSRSKAPSSQNQCPQWQTSNI